ncbi:hypothetical protein [Pseudomonas fluorescens]|uniref:hypothetical protein n=1 Tax=Pseudomonas fluorescens TaxID=294 RepID=UPI00054B2A3F|nr:hypothetical protein [Pseudomonas fluorescens]KII29732.1 hypothetical protein RY26_26270 [Pseudomonas fluorescens]
MDQALLNDIISTSVGGAAGGAVAALVVLGVQGVSAAWKSHRDARRIYNWLKSNSDLEHEPFRSTRAIASHNDLTEDRVRFVCSRDSRIKLSTGKEEGMWSIHIRRRIVTPTTVTDEYD